MRYKTAHDFRKALEERLKTRAQRESVPLARLRKRVVFERCLVRLQAAEDAPWVLKGGVALELRLGLQARMTKDLDLALESSETKSGQPTYAEMAKMIREALQGTQEDFFEFVVAETGSALPVRDALAYRINIESHLGGRLFEALHIDVGIGDPILAPIEEIEGSDLLEFAAIEQPRFKAISAAQHFAEKVHAFTKPYEGRVNTRVKDLADLLLLTGTQVPEVERLRTAVERVFAKRASHPVPGVLPEAPVTWTSSFSAMASELGLAVTTPQEAVDQLNRLWAEVLPGDRKEPSGD